MNEKAKSIYDRVVREPRLFEEEDIFYRNSGEKSAETDKYKQFMDRAFMEIERMQKELQEAKLDAQEVVKIRKEKDEQIQRLNQKFEEERQFNEARILKKQQELEEQREHLMLIQEEEKHALSNNKITATQLENNSSLFTDDAKDLLLRKAQSDLISQQEELISTLQKSENTAFPITLGECQEKFKLTNPLFNANDDFCQADEAKLTEVILNYYKIKNLELQIVVENEILEKIQKINVDRQNFSGILEEDEKEIDVSVIDK